MSDLTETPKDRKARQDFDDLQNEVAGRETGRIARFGVGGGTAQTLDEKKKRERRLQTALQVLMNDPEYARLYTELGGALSEAERKTDVALEQAQDALRQAGEDLRQLLDRAPRLPDGKRAFRDAEGRVLDEDGDMVPGDIADGILWPDDAPSHEDYQAHKDRVEALDSYLGNLTTYRNDTLGSIRDRYDDEDNPMTKDEIRDALEAIEAERPKLVADFASNPETPDTTTKIAPMAFPEMWLS